MKKILYLMHVDWNWIKQRPHHIAEGLSKHYDVTIVYPYNLKRKQLVKNNKTGIKLIPIIRVPFINKFYALKLMDQLVYKTHLTFLIKKYKPDYVWITFPDLFSYINHSLNCKIVYDCMDDAGEFSTKDTINSNRVNLEIDLINKSSLVFVSSMNLFDIISKRSNNIHKPILIRNAFDMRYFRTVSSQKKCLNKDIFKICYIGTISSWFDFDALYFCVQNIKNIEFHIIGPVTINNSKWSHERIILHGPKDHNILPTILETVDCTIMPFILNKLVMSVDPVKLYEYINYGKPIISIYYKEIERFSDYVTFYSTKEELLQVIYNMVNNGFETKYNERERREFLERNSWNSRMSDILNNLKKLN